MGNLCSSEPKADGGSSLSRVKSVRDAHKIRRDAVFRDIYKVGKTVGHGGFSVVKMVTDKNTNEQLACKIISLPPPGKEKNENESTRDDIFKEIDILMSLRHPNIIYLREYFEENNKIYIIMEYLGGGELLEALLHHSPDPDNDDPHYSEQDARTIFKQLIAAVEYMHSKEVVHRDLKLENLLLTRPKDITSIKVADFGLAKKYAGDVTLSTICGTPQYVAPEVIKGGKEMYTYGKECDLWSCGVILFVLLGGYPPFYDESEPKLFQKIRDGRYSFNDPVWKPISDEAKDLIRKLLEVDPTKRLTVAQVVAHPWMQDSTESVGSKRELLETMSKMRSSMKRRGLPAAVPLDDDSSNVNGGGSTAIAAAVAK